MLFMLHYWDSCMPLTVNDFCIFRLPSCCGQPCDGRKSMCRGVFLCHLLVHCGALSHCDKVRWYFSYFWHLYFSFFPASSTSSSSSSSSSSSASYSNTNTKQMYCFRKYWNSSFQNVAVVMEVISFIRIPLANSAYCAPISFIGCEQ